MKLRAPQKVRQQRRVLLVALYLLKNRYGVPRPPKKQVLNFIELRRLMHIPEADEDYRTTGDMIWQNDLAWKRNGIREEGMLQMPERGIWQITASGEKDVEDWAKRLEGRSTADPEWRVKLLQESDDLFHFEYYITDELFDWAHKIATGTLHTA